MRRGASRAAAVDQIKPFRSIRCNTVLLEIAGCVRAHGFCGVNVGRGAGLISPAPFDYPTAVHARRTLGLDLEPCLKIRERSVQLIQLYSSDAPIEVSHRVVRRELYHHFEVLNGSIKLPRPQISLASIVPR